MHFYDVFLSWTTRIELPLKASAQMTSLAARFHDVQPSLLLFLHRLRRISVINEVDDHCEEMTRHDLADDVIEIRHAGGSDRWLVVRRSLDASAVSSYAKSDVEVESTEVALAFKLQSPEHTHTQVTFPYPNFSFPTILQIGGTFFCLDAT